MEEVFRLVTEIGKVYKYAEYTEFVGLYPNRKYYAPIKNITFVGKLIEIKEGGFSDGGWRIDIFDNEGVITEVVYSYEGRTCFISV